MSLYNCRGLFLSLNLVETLVELTQLQHLDLSRGDPDEPIRMQSYLKGTHIMADKDFLEKLLPCLPALTWLDLSGEFCNQSLKLNFDQSVTLFHRLQKLLAAELQEKKQLKNP